MAMSDRIAIMRDGVILQSGTPDDIYHRPINRYVAEFIGDPPINILACEVRTDGATVADTAIADGIIIGRGGLPAGRYLLAVRPHDITMEAKPGQRAGTIALVEYLGAEDVVHVAYGADLVAVITRHGEAKTGDNVSLAVRRGKAHIIDQASGLVMQLERQREVA
jgi:multiple sugar transport system ATP-binding protein